MVAVAEAGQTIHQRFYRQQLQFLNDSCRYPAFVGGRNSGKTFTGAYKALVNAANSGIGLIAGPSFPSLKIGAKPVFLKLLEDEGIDYRENRQENKAYIYSFNAEIQFAGLENDTYIRGPNYAWGWIDELDYVGNPEMWKATKAAVRSGENYQLFTTTTPRGRYIVYGEWVKNADDFHHLYHATSFDNFFIDAEDYVAGLGYVGNFYEQEINAEFVTFEGLVYPNFDRLTAVRTVECADWPAAIGLDYGFNAPTCILTLRHLGERFHVEREVYRRRLSDDDIKDLIRVEVARVDADFVVADVNAQNTNEALRREGVKVRIPQKQGKVGDSIALVAGVLPQLTVDPSCVNILAEFESYQYPAGEDKDKPLPGNDHAMDALRYLVMELSKPRPKAVAATAEAKVSSWR